MGGKKRILLTAAAIILLCLTILVGATLGLFSDGVTVHNHLQAGDLEADLVRTGLKYVALNAKGQLQEYEVPGELNLSNTTLSKVNIFGLKNDEMIIAPKSYFTADLELRNVGNVAFDYTVKLVFTGSTVDNNDEALAEQLLITVKQGTKVIRDEVPLVEFKKDGANYIILSGELLVDASKSYTSVPFTVTVEFDNDNSINNYAQVGTTTFDLIVEAVQSATIVK